MSNTLARDPGEGDRRERASRVKYSSVTQEAHTRGVARRHIEESHTRRVQNLYDRAIARCSATCVVPCFGLIGAITRRIGAWETIIISRHGMQRVGPLAAARFAGAVGHWQPANS